MVSDISEQVTGDEYPKEDKCRYCAAHVGYILHPIAEALALHLCDKPECQEKAKNDRNKRK